MRILDGGSNLGELPSLLHEASFRKTLRRRRSVTLESQRGTSSTRLSCNDSSEGEGEGEGEEGPRVIA